VEAVRDGGGPYFIEFRTYRFRAHSMYDPELYRDKSEVEAWKQRDPLTHWEQRLRQDASLDDASIAAIEEAVATEIDAAIAFAENGSLEPTEDLTRFVYHEAAR
jgi:TPP-dependent pyruvate/acetoin dehydrogenase alpha subunit